MSYKFGHQVAPLALVRNLSTRLCHFDPLDFVLYSGRVTHTDNQNNAGKPPEHHRNKSRNNPWNNHWKNPDILMYINRKKYSWKFILCMFEGEIFLATDTDRTSIV